MIVPLTVLAGLLDDQAALVADTPGLIVTETLTDALTTVEEQILHRTRVCVAREADTIPALRDAHPSTEALPPLLLIADATAAHEHARTAALLTQGQRLDIHGVLLGPWPYGDTVTVAGDGFTTSAEHKEQQGIHPPEVGRLAVMTTADTLDLLATLTAAHQPSAAKSGNADSAAREQSRLTASTPGTADAGVPAGADATPRLTGTLDTTTTAETSHRSSAPPTVAGPSGDHGGRVKVQVLGGAHILGRDTSLPLRAKALELLVYLTVHDGEATQDAILDDLLPDAPASKAPHRLHTYVSALRKALAHTGGPATYLTHTTHRYTLNRHTIDTDLWQMRAALRAVDRATTDTDRLTALRRAVDAYRGNLADGFDYEWIEAHREGIRRQALDAHLTLATTTPDPNEALTVIQAAIRHDPYAEPLYQQAMRIHAALGHADAIHALREDLTRRLADIDAQPSETTLALAHRLIADPRPHRPAGHPRRRDHGPRS
ncbi:hypothetical protein E1258_01240 [Micromonospora sp. KC207]|uniref:AfsR/SARP family transcriptional regulator n=1 Tax=Micromonospora sp. KC207 TaxID=2530377 RepID=UPI0010457053|nr:BTAD domain-containing putative transcriptional regulator [Micromonospora sp. KC207]TDC66893.1 hypothetical protein E1258_01240 [Micromonospora sp. KC207]